MIVDAFPFYNELDLLDMRLHELWDVVDWFVLVEAPVTHSGKPKPLYYFENMDRFGKLTDKVINIIDMHMPIEEKEIIASLTSKDLEWLESGYQYGDNWVRERHQRNAMMSVIDGLNDDDIVIIEDADEMVRPEILQNIRETIVDGSNAVGQTLHTYYLNWKCTNMTWAGSKILKKKFITTPSEDRFHTPASKVILNGGWHFNFLGGVDAIKQKLLAYAHDEYSTQSVLDGVEINLQNKLDALGRQYKYEVVPIDDTYPKYLLNNLDKFDRLIYKGS